MSPNQMQQAILRGQAPAGVVRVDRGDPALYEQPHAHFAEGAALNKDGTWKHGETNLTNEQRQWLADFGWSPPA